jgi:hypothetical protein
MGQQKTGLVLAAAVAELVRRVWLDGQDVTERTVAYDDRAGYVVLLPPPLIEGTLRGRPTVLYPMMPDGQRIRHEVRTGEVRVMTAMPPGDVRRVQQTFWRRREGLTHMGRGLRTSAV